MIAVDTSAFVAIVAGEPERAAMLECLWRNDTILVSPVTVAEARMVVAGRFNREAETKLLEILDEPNIRVAPIRQEDLDVLHDAFLRYGRGSGSGAKLNMGDLFSYALAKSRDIPLLYKGNDFSRTDIRSALPA